MKRILLSITAVFICLQVNSQVTRKTTTRTKASATKVTRTNTTNQTTSAKAGKQPVQPNTPTVQPRQTITDKRLNGATGTDADTSSGKTTAKETPFANGVRPAENASRSFDTVAANSNNANLSRGSVTIAGGNDTTFNTNTTSQNSVNTNSGAVDRSGQSQFGQTNWGRDTRNTVGESQWTIPPPVTSSFNKEFPTANIATWSRNNVDTTIYSARYKSGPNWVTSSYNSAGERLETRFEIPLVQAPRAVSIYLAKQPSNVRIASISRLQIEGKPDVYEIKKANGKTVYVNNDGMEIEL